MSAARRGWIWRAIAAGAMTLAMLGLKRHYAQASVESLAWIMAPTAKLVSLAGGVHFDLERGAGYISREHLFVIAKPCAGINFMVAALGMLGFSSSSRVRDPGTCAGAVVASLLLAYLASVLVNSARILVAIEVGSRAWGSAFWTAARVHRAEGIVTYFGGLVLLHAAVSRVLPLLDRPRRAAAHVYRPDRAERAAS